MRTIKILPITILIFSMIVACRKRPSEHANLPDFPEFSFNENGSVTNLKPVLPTFDFNLIIDNVDSIKRDIKTLGTATLDGKGVYDNYTGSLSISGRGNSSFTMYPKKPYKIKLDSKSKMLGLPSSKKWIMLAEFIDGSMLYNSVAFGTAHLLGIPYTNHFIPIEITLNGRYNGIYGFSESKDVGESGINIGEDGTLLEIDAYYDEVWKFHSKNYNLPVMISYPEEEDMTQAKLDAIKADYEKLEGLIKSSSFPNNDYYDYLDIPSFIDYMIVNDLCLNTEINSPKSVYMNKKNGGKWNMGIVWDFDWGFGYASVGKHYDLSTANNPMFTSTKPMELVFKRLFTDPRVKKLYAKRWKWFKSHKYSSLKSYITSYANAIRPGFDKDHDKWGKRGSSLNLDTDLQRVLNWLDARAAYMDGQVSKW